MAIAKSRHKSHQKFVHCSEKASQNKEANKLDRVAPTFQSSSYERASRKISVYVYLWGWFWDWIETLHILSWISVKLSREYLVHLSWIKLASNPRGLDCSTGKAVDRCPEGASSNPARVNNFQLTSAVSDYHEKFLFTPIWPGGMDNDASRWLWETC